MDINYRNRKNGRFAPTIPERTCIQCSVTFRPKRKDRISFCSRECGHAHQKRQAARRKIIDAASVRCVVYRKDCKNCGARFSANIKTQKYCSNKCSHVAATKRKYPHRQSPRFCPTCGNVFSPKYGEWGRIYCSRDCLTKSEVLKKANRVSRMKRRAAERCATVDDVDPIVVLERDGWVCKLCGCETPKELRGTYEPNAPEVDHIVPIAHGGMHSYQNTQCLCRSCNAEKSSTCFGIFTLRGTAGTESP